MKTDERKLNYNFAGIQSRTVCPAACRVLAFRESAETRSVAGHQVGGHIRNGLSTSKFQSQRLINIRVMTLELWSPCLIGPHALGTIRCLLLPLILSKSLFPSSLEISPCHVLSCYRIPVPLKWMTDWLHPGVACLD